MTQSLSDRTREAVGGLPEELQTSARQTISSIPTEAASSLDALEALLLDEESSAEVRASAAWLTGLLKEGALGSTLEQLVFEEQERGLLWEVAKALCSLELGHEGFREALVNWGDAGARQVAAYAAGHLHDPRAVGALIAILEGREEPSALRGQAAESLGLISDGEALSSLLQAAEDPSAEVRFWSAYALGELGDPTARPVLERLARDDHDLVPGWWTVAEEARDALTLLPA